MNRVLDIRHALFCGVLIGLAVRLAVFISTHWSAL